MQAERNGTMPMPMGPGQRAYGPGGIPNEMGGFGPIGMPRSPPKNKSTYTKTDGSNMSLRKITDTQHVPCKFFLSGQCQAGRTCPFSHDVESTTRPAPCKYFAKGHCKFGRKCALLHVTPDGQVVNRAQPFMPPAAGYPPTQGQGRGYPQPPPPGLLSQGFEQRPGSEQVPSEYDNYQYAARNGYDVPQIDTTYVPGSPQYGSPPQNDSRMAGSPSGKGLSVLDAPLPSSFDSNGVSMAARHGPLAQSVPTKFGIESPPSSLPNNAHLGNTAIRDLHKSAYGDRGMDNVLAGSSPPSGPDEPLTFPKRPLHISRLQRPGQQVISASLGAGVPNRSFEYSDDEDGSDREEDLLPASLRDLIPESKSRRESRARNDEDTNTPASFLAAQRRTISGQATPSSESKVGSPLSSSPTSRYNNMFSRRPADGDGLVGSPLRNSSFGGFSNTIPNNNAAATSRPTANGDLSPTVASPPRQAAMSMLTQELQRTKLDAARSHAAAASSVGMTRTKSGGSTGRSSLERAVSGQSVGRERIDEEQVDMFDMEDMQVGDAGGGRGGGAGASPRAIPNGRERRSGSFSRSPGEGEGRFGAIGGHRTPK